jgi:hypothetical protein
MGLKSRIIRITVFGLRWLEVKEISSGEFGFNVYRIRIITVV